MCAHESDRVEKIATTATPAPRDFGACATFQAYRAIAGVPATHDFGATATKLKTATPNRHPGDNCHPIAEDGVILCHMAIVLKCPHCDSIVDNLIPVDVTPRQPPPRKQDAVAEWLRGFDWTSRMSSTTLYANYEIWSRARGEWPASHRDFSRSLVILGASRIRTKEGSFFEPPHN
jgi:hypothetical protein